MYIEEYWGNYIGGTDDSLNLVDYLEDKQKKDILLSEIFMDLGLDKLKGNYTQTNTPLEWVSSNGVCMVFYYAIDLITDLAALLLECKKTRGVNLHDIGTCENPDSIVNIIATPKEYRLIKDALKDFALTPLTYDLSEMVPDNDLKEMAEICERLRQELIQCQE